MGFPGQSINELVKDEEEDDDENNDVSDKDEHTENGNGLEVDENGDASDDDEEMPEGKHFVFAQCLFILFCFCFVM